VTGIQQGQREGRRYSRLPRQGDFWRLWLVGLVMSAVRWIEMLVVAIFTYQATGSAFIVTMMTLLRLLPMALFGAFMGAWADRLDRRRALVGILIATLLSSAAIAVLAWSGRVEVWHLAVSCFINGTAWATDNAVRRIMMGEVVGADKMATAMAFDIGANNASRMVGPALGGVLLATAGIESAFTLSVGLYLVGIAAALGLAYRKQVAHASATSMLGSIAEGLREVRHRPHLMGILAVTAIFNIFGWPSHSLVPVIGKDNLALGPEGVGVLSSMEGVGAIIGAAWVIVLANPRHYHTLYVGSVVVVLGMMMSFALMSEPFFAGVFLVATGISGACFAVMQTTLLYRAVAPEMRSRMLGLLSVSIGVGPIGFLQVGLLAEAFGARTAIVIIALEGLVALALTWPLWRVRDDR
jgi:predicted MFS family arabinose efflux permease